MPEITGNVKVDRLPVIISHINGEQLLGVPKLSTGKGIDMCDAIYELLVEWNVDQNISALCCDTTFSNTGKINGAASLLEQKLERDLLYLPCRHHIYEIVLRAVFESKFGSATSGSDVPLFKRFQSYWPNINKMNFKPVLQDEKLFRNLIDVKEEISNFYKYQLEKQTARDDYLELLQLTLICLGTSSKTIFRYPGPMHHARWMSKALYSLKIYLFRTEFNLTEFEENNLRDICAFIIRFYVKAWFKCPAASLAPYQDLCLIREIYNYKSCDKQISEAVIKKFSNHLWYLSDECVALSLFDENVSNEIKREISDKIKTLKSNNYDGDDTDYDDDVDVIENMKRVPLKPSEIGTFIQKGLPDFVTGNTHKFFNRFGISTNFLNEDPFKWNENEAYIEGKNIIHHLNVVNDAAERGVKLIEEYNKVLTKKEDEKQYLLQVVTDYRKNFKSHTKTALSSTKS